MKRQLFTAIGLIPLALGGSALAQSTGDNKNNPAGAQPSPTASTPAVAAPSPTAAPAPLPTATAASATPAAPPAAAPAASLLCCQQPGGPRGYIAYCRKRQPMSLRSRLQKMPIPRGTLGNPRQRRRSPPRGAESNASAISLAPTAPQVSTLPGSVTPGFEQAASISPGDWKFDVHGLFILPLAIGINSRAMSPTQGRRRRRCIRRRLRLKTAKGFNWTGVTPQPWVQMNFSYGNRDVTANVILSARTVTNANSYFNPA